MFANALEAAVNRYRECRGYSDSGAIVGRSASIPALRETYVFSTEFVRNDKLIFSGKRRASAFGLYAGVAAESGFVPLSASAKKVAEDS